MSKKKREFYLIDVRQHLYYPPSNLPACTKHQSVFHGSPMLFSESSVSQRCREHTSAGEPSTSCLFLSAIANSSFVTGRLLMRLSKKVGE